MAPDINTVGSEPLANHKTDGYADNGVPRSEEYTIPDVVLHGPYTRKIKVLSIGAGVTGIMNAYHIQKYLKNVEHVIYEKNEDIGGTWLENRYPGAACDIPSHAYTFPFALNPDWPRFFSYSPDIWKYLNKVCEVWGLRKYMNFHTEVIGAYWQEDTGEWLIKLKETKGGQSRLFDERCHILLHGTGILNNFKWPDIEGIETFKGRIVHTARWPNDYQAEQWKSDRVAVIGSGASSIQTVPTMQPHAKHLDVFVRTPVWFVEIANNFGANHAYTDEQKQSYRDPANIVEHAKSIEDQVNGLWGTFFKNATAQKEGQKMLKARMAEFIKDERLLEGYTPSWGIGCRRVTPGDPYMQAIQKENVDVHFTAVDKITPNGVTGSDGQTREVDTIVCATGFDVSYRPRFPIIGRNGVDLADKWRVCPEGYLGLAIPDFPNFLTFIGPNWPVENGSVMGPLMFVSYYALQMIRKMQSEYVHSWMPKQDVTDEFNAHCQEWVRHTVWTEDCRSWYKNNETGRVNAVWPGSSLHYIEAIREVRWEDMEVRYMGPAKKNRWAYLGMGTTKALVEKGDPSPYLSVKGIDPEWMRAMGMQVPGSEREVGEKVDEVAGKNDVEAHLAKASYGEPEGGK